jgi:hypothetical protein
MTDPFHGGGFTPFVNGGNSAGNIWLIHFPPGIEIQGDVRNTEHVYLLVGIWLLVSGMFGRLPEILSFPYLSMISMN